jgi:hypothetical protein
VQIPLMMESEREKGGEVRKKRRGGNEFFAGK